MAEPAGMRHQHDDRGADAPLVAAARRGDRFAFGALHARYGKMVHAILLGRVPARDAADLVQDVFLRALERIASLRDDAAFGGWLAQIARHRAADHLRARRGESGLPEDLAARDAGTGRAEAAQALAAIRALPDAYCETLLMRLVEGMTGDEIAARTGLTPGSVRVNLHRGMRLLRERLGLPASLADEAKDEVEEVDE
ncbi:MAG TPA: sigma-70 family RNA polymerase sigma factor [Haliangiales bacterium]|nr:sigma-70 family RNA polymerase sigma factor [Haliangiales bacterium]